MGKMRHPHVVSVEDFGTSPTGETFLVMEFVQGQTLEHIIASQGPLPAPRAGLFAKQIALGLANAHAGGFVHRDIKPANIMISRQGTDETVKVLDFGAVSLRSLPRNERLTSVGHIIGTPTYMAPEQSQDPNVGPTADLYALGAVLFEMLTQSPPFTGAGRAQVLVKHITEEAPAAPPSQGLERLVAQLLRKLPSERPQTGEAVAAFIDSLDLESSDNEVTTINEMHPFPSLGSNVEFGDWSPNDADTDERAEAETPAQEPVHKPAAFAATHVVRERITPSQPLDDMADIGVFPVMPAPMAPLDDSDDGGPTQLAADAIEIGSLTPERAVSQFNLRPLINAAPRPMTPADTLLEEALGDVPGHSPLPAAQPRLPGFISRSDTLPLTPNLLAAAAAAAKPTEPSVARPTAPAKPRTPLLHYFAIATLLITIGLLGWALWPAADTVELVPGIIVDEP